jgi:hypothetical protein
MNSRITSLLRLLSTLNDYAVFIFWLTVGYLAIATLDGAYWENHSLAWAVLVGSGLTMVVTYFSKETKNLLELTFQAFVFPIGVVLFLMLINWR